MVLTVSSSETHGLLDGQNLLRQYQTVFETLGVGLSILHPISYIEELEAQFSTTIQSLKRRNNFLLQADDFLTENASQKLTINPRQKAQVIPTPEEDRVDLNMNRVSQEAQKVLDKLGPFVSPNTDNLFDGLPVQGPKKFDSGTYKGQFYNGKKHGFGTFVRLLIQVNL